MINRRAVQQSQKCGIQSAGHCAWQFLVIPGSEFQDVHFGDFDVSLGLVPDRLSVDTKLTGALGHFAGPCPTQLDLLPIFVELGAGFGTAQPIGLVGQKLAAGPMARSARVVPIPVRPVALPNGLASGPGLGDD